MSNGAGTTGQAMNRKVLYTIHYTPCEGSLPQIPKKPWRLAGLDLPVKGRYRDLYAKISVNSETQRCDLDKEGDLIFPTERGSDVDIEVYAKYKAGPECIARKTRKLVSLISADVPVRLDMVNSRVDTAPTLSLKVTVRSFDHKIGEDVSELANSLALSEKWLALGDYARRVIDIGGIVAEAHPVAKAIFSILELGVEELEKKKEYHNNILSLVACMTRSCEIVLDSDTQQYSERRENQVNACNALVSKIFCALSFIRALVWKNTVSRLRSEINKEVVTLCRGLNGIADAVRDARNIDTQSAVFRVENMVNQMDIDNTLSHLQIAKGVEAASEKACRPNTRVKLLETIMDWVFDPDGSRCFCLYGTAGQGKTAVAHTVARQLTDMGLPAPFFAFDRNNRERVASQLFPTLSRKLAYTIQHHLEQLRRLRADLLETVNIHDQCERLLLSCLREYLVLKPIIIIIDALDECPNDSLDNQRDRAALLKALRTCLLDKSLHHNVRFLITARLDPDIKRAIARDCRLYSIETTVDTKADIRSFVSRELEGTWDAACYVELVTEAAQAHFECAAVLCRELTNWGKPMSKDARSKLIERIKSQPGRSLYEMYQLILETHLDKTDAGCLSVYRQLLTWILAVRQPQSRAFLEEISMILLPQEDVMGVLGGLGSLLTGTVSGAEEPIRPLHTSFRDFVLDAEASGPFTIKPVFAAADSQLALACFGIMGRPKSGLRYNICDLPSPFVYKKDINDLDHRLTEQMSPGVQYACREVSTHLAHSQPGDPDLMPALKRFLQDQFFFWLEACGWLGYEPCDSLRNMLHWIKKLSQGDLAAIVAEFIAFEKRFREAISESPPQVYVTGLLFAPVNSHVSRLYRHRITSPIDISGYEKEQEWPLSEPLVIQAGSSVYSIAYSPDGTKIISGLSDCTLRMWDAETGRQVGGAMREHIGVVDSAAFSPDGSRIASGSRDHTVRLWDAKTRQQRGEALRGHTNRVRSVAFSPDGTTVVSASEDSTLRLWDAKAGKEIGEAMKGHTRGVHSVVFSHDGARIVSSADDRTIRIWDTAARQQLGNPIWHEDEVRSVSISRDGKYVASGSDDGTVRVWDEGGRQQVWASHGHTGWVRVVAFSLDSTRIVSGGDDNTVRIWDVASGEQVGDDLRGHAGDIISVAFSPDGQHIASGSYAGTLRVWHVREVEKERDTTIGHTRAVTSVACSPDGKYIVSGSRDQTVRLWNAETGQPVGDPIWDDDHINCVAFSPDSTRIATASDGGTVRVENVETPLPAGEEIQGHYDQALCVAFSPDGTRLVSGSADKTLRLWDLATSQQIGHALRGHSNCVRFVSFSSDGSSIASGSLDCVIRLWDTRTQQRRWQALKGHQHYVWSVAFSPDGAFLVSGSFDTTIRLWNVKTGEQLGTLLTGHTDWVRSVSFSHNGKYVVSGSDDWTVRVWDVQTRQQVGVTLRGHEGWVNSVALNSDGARIVSGSDDGTIRVWDFGNLQSSEDFIGVANAFTTRARAQAALRKGSILPWNGWMVYDELDGSERPLIWIPHHLRHYHRITSSHQIQFVPPAPHIRITLNDSIRLDEWPVYTPAPAAEEPSGAL